MPDNADPDSDGDGVLDIAEGRGIDPSADVDGDAIPNFRDPDFHRFVDTNGDGVNDAFDLDSDGIPNHLDVDADGDRYRTTSKAQNLRPMCPGRLDTDGDGLDDAYDHDAGRCTVIPLNSDGEGARTSGRRL
ncbi:MAG: hypothetical protein R3E84_14555 [Pseudomonadales bacterium]